ncbi:MAG: AAA family ATPase [Persicimonas sp.]
MKITLPIALRRYSDRLVIATSLDSVDLSVAADDGKRAREKLRAAVARAAGRTHPRAIARFGRLSEPRVERVELPVYRRRDVADPDEWIARPIPVATRSFGDLLQWRALGLGRDIWVRRKDDESLEEARARGLQQLTEALRVHERTLRLHRAPPEAVTVDTISVDFDPLDLSHIPVDALWLNAFAAIEMEEDEDDAATPTLEEVATRWTREDEAERDEGDLVPAFERDDLVEQLEELLFGAQPAAVVLVGPSRVGKTSLVKHIAWHTSVEPDAVGGRRLWFADSPRLTATDPMSEGWQKQCTRLVEELEEADDVLYLGRLIQALDAGKYIGSDYNLAQLLAPHLADRRLRIVAEATVEEWSRIEQRDAGFARKFNVLRVGEPAEKVGWRIVELAAGRLAEREGIELDEEAVERAWRLERRFATEGSPVGHAIDFLERTVRRAVQQYTSRLTGRDIVERFCDETGLPPVMLLDERKLDLERVEAELSERVMGQPTAVRRIVDVVGITKAGLAPADRPLGSFFFVGPTGVGKTELARALAEFLFGDENRLIRLDMSEYNQPKAYTRLIGDGEQPGDLTEPVRRQPFSVVLLDEVEKAHRSAFDLLLQVLGEARLTDADGRTTRFQNTIVIMTSNLGVGSLDRSIGFGTGVDDEAWEGHFRAEAERHFRPEFLARIDQFVPFGSLSREVVEAISRRELKTLEQRHGLVARDVTVEFDDAVVQWVAARGWDEQYGARPIERVVEQEVAWPLANALARAEDEHKGADSEQGEAAPPQVVTIEVDAEGPEASLSWTVETIDDQEQSLRTRRGILSQVEKIAGLRRRLERCMHGGIFAELEWTVHDFDTTSHVEGFWELPDAAQVAQDAEHARQLLASVDELSQELEAMEDLVREAYHARAFELSVDIDERVAQIEPRIQEVVLELLRTAYEEPDRVVLLLPSKDPTDPWREQLVRWYQQLAGLHNWKLEMRRAKPRQRRPDESVEPTDRREALWERARKRSGSVLALEFQGRGVRPLLIGEDGLHRHITDEESFTVEVVVLTEGVDWPKPSSLETERPSRPTARIWNERTGEITTRGFQGIPFDPDRPWKALWPKIEEIAWELAGEEWW